VKILMVSPYPPTRDGIGAYAVQAVARLRRDGHEVEVLSPGPSAAHHHLALRGPRGALALAKRVRKYDKVIVQYHPDVFYTVPSKPSQWAMESMALFLTFLAARVVEVRLHEIDYNRGRGLGPYAFFNRLPWRAVSAIYVHTEKEREEFAAAYRVPENRVVVTDHGSDFQRYTRLRKSEARASLGLSEDEFVFLNIGFIQPHKGFDRSIRALARMRAGPSVRLDVVGSVRVPEPAFLDHLEQLKSMSAATPGANLHEGFVTDELFDRWIVASDTVVLPYRSIWSSGVLERALLYERPVITTDVGGLDQQTRDRDLVTVVRDDAELLRAMGDAIGLHDPGAVWGDSSGSWAAPGGGTRTRDEIQSEIRRRAAVLRGAPSSAALGGYGTTSPSRANETASAPVRNVHPLGIPKPLSRRLGARLGAKTMKRVAWKMTAWEIEPIIHQVNSLREAAIKAIERVEQSSD
jgi:glycosyltransferase involved in cell wall biosynthesis